MLCNLDVNKFKGHSFWIRMIPYSASRGWLIVRLDLRHVTKCWYMLWYKRYLGLVLVLLLVEDLNFELLSVWLTYGGIYLSSKTIVLKSFVNTQGGRWKDCVHINFVNWKWGVLPCDDVNMGASAYPSPRRT